MNESQGFIEGLIRSAAIRVITPMRFGFLVAAVVSAGCTTHVEVFPDHQSSSRPEAGSYRLAGPWWADPQSSAILREHELEKLISANPDLALQKLHGAVSDSANVESVTAAADLTLRYALTLERAQPQQAAGWNLAAAALAYRPIASGASLPTTNPWNLPIVQTYNRATAGAVTLLQKLPGSLRTNHVLSAGGFAFRVAAQAGDAESSPHEFDQWLVADHWQQKGLQQRHRNDGLGARLIAVRTNRLATALDKHLPDEGVFRPATAILRFQRVHDDPVSHIQKVNLLFYNPKYTPQIEAGDRQWPLAADYTIPGAMLLSHTRPLFKTRWTALMRPSETTRPNRLYLFEPYSPDRIPIIMVHGLRSTPLAWQQMTNELLGDADIRARYQIWHYLYPTGLPFLTTAADFRDELETVRNLLDPTGQDLATQHMIVIAHSMGGLLARTLVTDSGDELWNSTFAIPVADLDPSLEQLPELRRMFYFRANPCVKRVIFIAVPHRGSKAADSLVGRLVSGWVTLPDNFHQFITSLEQAVPGLLKPEAAPLFENGYPDSISVLSPKTPGLVAMAKLPVSATTPFHSIMGDRGRGGGENSSDGVVPYSSSHLTGASSELIVASNHRVPEHPDAIAEVKRILKLHVAELGPQERFVFSEPPGDPPEE